MWKTCSIKFFINTYTSIPFRWLASLKKYQFRFFDLPFCVNINIVISEYRLVNPIKVSTQIIFAIYLSIYGIFIYHVLMSVLRKMRLQNMYKNIFKLIRFCYRLCCKLQNHLMIIFDCNNLINKLYFFVTLKLPHWINIIWHLFVLF